MACNIDQSDRINRVVIGLIIFFAALTGASSLFFMAVGIIMVVQGLIGWCSLPYLTSLLKQKNQSK